MRATLGAIFVVFMATLAVHERPIFTMSHRAKCRRSSLPQLHDCRRLALTGGIGFAAGAAFSGAKYEYADSFNMTGTKPKYKGKELEQLQSQGVHVIVVNKKTASAEMDSARNSCKASTAAPAPQATQTSPVTPVQTPVKASAPVCVASTIDANGKENCSQYAKQ